MKRYCRGRLLTTSVCLSLVAVHAPLQAQLPQRIDEATLQRRAWAVEAARVSLAEGEIATLALAAAPYLNGDVSDRKRQLEEVTASVMGLTPQAAFSALDAQGRNLLAKAVMDAFGASQGLTTPGDARTWAIHSLSSLADRARNDPNLQRSVEALAGFTDIPTDLDVGSVLQRAGVPRGDAQRLLALASSGRLTEESLRRAAGGLVESATDDFVRTADQLPGAANGVKIGSGTLRAPGQQLLNEMRQLDACPGVVRELSAFLTQVCSAAMPTTRSASEKQI